MHSETYGVYSGSLTLITADITTLAVDAIVNAANPQLAGGSGVNGAIQRAAGPQLLEASKIHGGCPTGQARITDGFNLPARYVIHAVGPVWSGGREREDELLASAYRASLGLAAAYGIRSIAFPAISCGIYGYPLERAARVALTAVRGAPFDVTFALFGEDILEVFSSAQEQLGS